MGIKGWIIPQDYQFFDLFEQLVHVVVESSYLLEDMVSGKSDAIEMQKKIKGLEHDGDGITHKIFLLLNQTFITPLDPLEISRLATGLDDVLDYIDDSAEKMVNYEIFEYDEFMKEFVHLIRDSVVQLEIGVKNMRTPHVNADIESCFIEVNRLENLADDLLSRAIHSLFEGNDAIKIIKYKDIYECFEISTDKCEDVVIILSDISIRCA